MNKPITMVIAVLGVLAIGAGVYACTANQAALPAADGAKKSGHGEKGHGEKNHGEESVVDMSDAKVGAAGIEILTTAEATLHDAVVLNGIVQPNQETLVQVTPRFPGVVREIKKRIGDTVEKNELLAKIESNQSLTTYEMRAPISGTVIDRQMSLGEYASEQRPAFVVADISTVWVDLSVYKRDLTRVRLGDTVVIDVGDDGQPIEAQLSYISPVGNRDTQSALVRAVVANVGTRLHTGLFVSARLILSAKPVPIAVQASAIQSLGNRSVVFVRNGEKFEARDVEIGRRDAENVEILFGLAYGEKYAGRNSFVVKAEMAKRAAPHDH